MERAVYWAAGMNVKEHDLSALVRLKEDASSVRRARDALLRDVAPDELQRVTSTTGTLVPWGYFGGGK